jgi:ABC-2 type transport system ATP-binding protein
MRKIISCQNLTKYYKGEKKPALDNLNLEVPENCIFGFLGPNGAGKTTSIKILTGLMNYNSGTVIIDDEIIQPRKTDFRKKIGYLGQEQRMFEWMTGLELLKFTARIFGQSKVEAKNSAEKYLEISGLSPAAGKKIKTYSGGMKQRLGIAQALIGNPKILFLDEPTSALDPIGRKEVLDFIYSIRNECTIFMCTHILADVERVCDYVAIISEGKLIEQNSISNIKSKYSSNLVEISFLNDEDISKFKSLVQNSSDYKIIENNDSSFKIIFNKNVTDYNDFLNLLINAGIKIKFFIEKEPTLEDVFVKLTTK